MIPPRQLSPSRGARTPRARPYRRAGGCRGQAFARCLWRTIERAHGLVSLAQQHLDSVIDGVARWGGTPAHDTRWLYVDLPHVVPEDRGASQEQAVQTPGDACELEPPFRDPSPMMLEETPDLRGTEGERRPDLLERDVHLPEQADGEGRLKLLQRVEPVVVRHVYRCGSEKALFIVEPQRAHRYRSEAREPPDRHEFSDAHRPCPFGRRYHFFAGVGPHRPNASGEQAAGGDNAGGGTP